MPLWILKYNLVCSCDQIKLVPWKYSSLQIAQSYTVFWYRPGCLTPIHCLHCLSSCPTDCWVPVSIFLYSTCYCPSNLWVTCSVYSISVHVLLIFESQYQYSYTTPATVPLIIEYQAVFTFSQFMFYRYLSPGINIAPIQHLLLSL
jgi:hypothetical protein